MVEVLEVEREIKMNEEKKEVEKKEKKPNMLFSMFLIALMIGGMYYAWSIGLFGDRLIAKDERYVFLDEMREQIVLEEPTERMIEGEEIAIKYIEAMYNDYRTIKGDEAYEVFSQKLIDECNEENYVEDRVEWYRKYEIIDEVRNIEITNTYDFGDGAVCVEAYFDAVLISSNGKIFDDEGNEIYKEGAGVPEKESILILMEIDEEQYEYEIDGEWYYEGPDREDIPLEIVAYQWFGGEDINLTKLLNKMQLGF